MCIGSGRGSKRVLGERKKSKCVCSLVIAIYTRTVPSQRKIKVEIGLQRQPKGPVGGERRKRKRCINGV